MADVARGRFDDSLYPIFQTTKGGNQINADFLIEVQKGNVKGHSLVHKFGRNDAVPNNSWEFINLLRFTAWPLSSFTAVRVKAGGDAADIAGGLGAQEVTVQGILASTLKEGSEAIATNGINASTATTKLFRRVHRAGVSKVGTYGAANTAAITIENSAGGTDLIKIDVEEGQTQFTAFTIPDGHTGYMLSAFVTIDAGKAADIRWYFRKDIVNTTAPMESQRLQNFWDGVIGAVPFKPRSPGGGLPGLTDIWFEARGGGAISQVSCDFELLMVEDGY